MRTILLGLVLLSGCGVATAPETQADRWRAWLESAEAQPPPDADASIDLVLTSFSTSMGERVPVTVRWWAGEQLPMGAARATGITFSCAEIWVWTASGKIGETSPLAHEIGHCVRAALLGGADAEHADRSWWDGPVDVASQALRRAGL